MYELCVILIILAFLTGGFFAYGVISELISLHKIEKNIDNVNYPPTQSDGMGFKSE